MSPHSSILAWKIPWMEEPGGLQSMGSWRVGHDRAISLSCIGEGNGNPLQCSCLENPRDGGAPWAAVYGVAQSQTWLMLLSSRSSRDCLHGFMKIFMKYCGMNKGQDKFPDVNCIPVQVQTLWMKKIYILFPRPGNVRRQQLTHMDSVKGKNRGVKHCR